MFGRRPVPVLRIDKLVAERERDHVQAPGDPVISPGLAIRYTFSADPETSFELRSWDALESLLRSLGTGEDRAGVRFARLVGGRHVAAEAFGSARLDRLFLRWSDTGLNTKLTPPWWFTISAPTGKLIRVPLGEVPANFDELSPSEYEDVAGLDLAAVPREAVVTGADAAIALRWFLETWPDESSPCLDWIKR